jgi:hypothetical protein
MDSRDVARVDLDLAERTAPDPHFVTRKRHGTYGAVARAMDVEKRRDGHSSSILNPCVL